MTTNLLSKESLSEESFLDWDDTQIIIILSTTCLYFI
jgi:hypothetical protein